MAVSVTEYCRGHRAVARTTRNRQHCIFPPLGAQTPASRILRINSFGTGSGFSRRIDRVVRMISNRSGPWLSLGMGVLAGARLVSRGCPMGWLSARIACGGEDDPKSGDVEKDAEVGGG